MLKLMADNFDRAATSVGAPSGCTDLNVSFSHSSSSAEDSGSWKLPDPPNPPVARSTSTSHNRRSRV